MNNNEQVIMLIAEDDDGHARLLLDSIEAMGFCNPVIRFRDGAEIWDFLSGTGTPCLEAGKPYLLLLDICMPRLDGVEVLRRVKADPHLKSIPVIILSTTDDPRDMARCSELGCFDFLVKPVTAQQIAEAVARQGEKL